MDAEHEEELQFWEGCVEREQRGSALIPGVSC